jgi:hypothetical protein
LEMGKWEKREQSIDICEIWFIAHFIRWRMWL